MGEAIMRTLCKKSPKRSNETFPARVGVTKFMISCSCRCRRSKTVMLEKTIDALSFPFMKMVWMESELAQDMQCAAPTYAIK